MAIAVVQLTPSHQVFGQVAALFDDYRAHYGQPPSPRLARVLVQHVVGEARAAGAGRVSVQTETDNHPALGLYAAAGFQPVSGLEVLNLSLRAPALARQPPPGPANAPGAIA